MIGVPGSGKSTWIKNNNTNAVIISKDDIRTMLWGYYVYDSKTEPLVSDIASKAILSAVSRGFDIIVDETNICREKRLKLAEMASGYEVVYVVFRNTDTLSRRIEDSKGISEDVWKDVITGMTETIEWPEPDEYDVLIEGDTCG
jgi:predicted kinase